MDHAYRDADAAALYDVLNPWDPDRLPGDAFYADLMRDADSVLDGLDGLDVLDVGCGTGAMLRWARAHGHRGRLAGIDPDRVVLRRARRPMDTPHVASTAHAQLSVPLAPVEYVEGTAAKLPWREAFDLAVMTGHAFQFLVTDDDVRDSLRAVRAALRPGGRFAFETRHPQARAWEDWNPSHAADMVDPAGRALRLWHQVDSVVDDACGGCVVAFSGTTAAADGTVLRVDRTRLRFLGVAALDAFLAGAGLKVEARFGDWTRGPLTAASREIVTIARRPA